MAFITINSTVKTIKVDFGIYKGISIPTGKVPKKKTYQKHYLEISLPDDSDYININTYSEVATFPVSFDGASNTFKIDSINGFTSITSNEHLYDLISELLD